MAEHKTKNKPIRLGLLRCDTHGYWYAPFLANCDPSLLDIHDHTVYHIYCTLEHADRLIIPKVSGFELAACWDEDHQRAKELSATFLNTAKVCRTPSEMADPKKIDAAFIADCSGDGDDKLELARPFIKKRIPVFIDKPFSAKYKDAKALVKLARQYRTPIMSASLLEYNPTAKRFMRRFDEIGEVGMIAVKGIGGVGLPGIIHGIALVRNFFGDGVEWVQAMGHCALHSSATRQLNRGGLPDFKKKTVPLAYLHMQYKNGKQAIVINSPLDFFPDRCDFHVSAFSKQDALHSPAIGDPEFIEGGAVILKLFRKMVRTRKPVVSYDSLLEKIAIVDAAVLSQRKGKPVYLKEVM